MPYDLILTGVQAADDRDGQIGVLLAHYLGMPHVSVVTGVAVSGGKVTVHKEYGGGVIAEFDVSLPAVLGIQAARQTPRYVPVARVRQAMRDGHHRGSDRQRQRRRRRNDHQPHVQTRNRRRRGDAHGSADESPPKSSASFVEKGV